MALYGAAKAPAVPANADGSTQGKLTAATYHIAVATSDTYTDAAVNTAVNAAVDLLVAQFNALIDHLNDGRR